jgi:hypothetical protein
MEGTTTRKLTWLLASLLAFAVAPPVLLAQNGMTLATLSIKLGSKPRGAVRIIETRSRKFTIGYERNVTSLLPKAVK